MTLLKIVDELRKEGHSVELRTRSDGGIIVVSIDGIKYTGKEGNKRARSIASVKLSTAQIEQRAKNVKYQKGRKRKKLKKLSQDIKKDLVKVQRLWRKTKSKGRVTTKKVRWILEHEGEEGAKEYLRKMKLYALGVAYEANVDYIIMRLERLKMQYPNNADRIQKTIDLIEEIKQFFQEKWIELVYNIVYEIEGNRININNGLSQIETIIRM